MNSMQWFLLGAAIIIIFLAALSMVVFPESGDAPVEGSRGQQSEPVAPSPEAESAIATKAFSPTPSRIEAQLVGSKEHGDPERDAQTLRRAELGARLMRLGLIDDWRELMTMELSASREVTLADIASKYEDLIKTKRLEIMNAAAAKGKELRLLGEGEDAPMDQEERQRAMKPTLPGQRVVQISGASSNGVRFERIVRINPGDHREVDDLQLGLDIVVDEGRLAVRRALSL